MTERANNKEVKPLPTGRIGALALKTFHGKEYHKRAAADKQRTFEADHEAQIRQQLASQTELISRITQLLGIKSKKTPGEYDWDNFTESFERKRVTADLADGSMLQVHWRKDNRDSPTLAVDLMNPARAHLEKKFYEGTPLPTEAKDAEKSSNIYVFKSRAKNDFATGMEGALGNDGYFVNYAKSSVRANDTAPDTYHSLSLTTVDTPLSLLRDHWEDLSANAGINSIYSGPNQEELLQLTTEGLRQAQSDALIPTGSQSTFAHF
jgi:hypothetical protein